MAMAYIALLYTLTAEVALVNGQLFAALHGTCLNSAQCLGLAICENRICQCPTGYSAMGDNCVVAENWLSSAPLPSEVDPAQFVTPASAPLLLAGLPTSPLQSQSSALQTVPQTVPSHASALRPLAVDVGHYLPFGSLQLGAPAPSQHPVRRTTVQYAAPSQTLLAQQQSAFIASVPTAQSGAVLIRPAPPPTSALTQPLYSPVAEAVPRSRYAYPGGACSLDTVCLGYSFCWRGRCACPRNSLAYGSLCISVVPIGPPGPSPPTWANELAFAQDAPPAVPWHIAALLPPAVLRGCPEGEVYIGSSCRPVSIIAEYPAGVPCRSHGHCGGGALCVHCLCMCPTGVWKMGGCVSGPAAPSMALGYPAAPPSHPQSAVQRGAILQGPHSPQYASSLPSWLQLLATQVQRTTLLVAVGSPCVTNYECKATMGSGAYCQMGICICRPAFERLGRFSCVIKKKAKDSNVTKKIPSAALGKAKSATKIGQRKDHAVAAAGKYQRRPTGQRQRVIKVSS